MNILYVTFSFNIGGIERLLVDIVNEASRDKKNNIYLCVINDSYDDYLLNQIKDSANIFLMKRCEGGKKLKYILSYTKYILTNKIDIIHCQGENEVKFSLLSKLLKPTIKIFTTIHDTYYKNLKLYEIIIEKLFCRKIIAISEAVRSQILLRGISKSKVVRIYNGINIDRFSLSEKKIYNLEKQIVVGNVSRLIPEKKGQDVLIHSISLLKKVYPNIKCILGGEPAGGNNSIVDDLKNLCEKLKVSENIIFSGKIEDVPKFLNSIDIFILPSRYEGFGISLIEAMCFGIPCIASYIDGPKEIIKNNRYGLLFKNNDHEDLANKIDYRIKNMKINNTEIKDYIKNNFNISNMVKELFKLYSV